MDLRACEFQPSPISLPLCPQGPRCQRLDTPHPHYAQRTSQVKRRQNYNTELARTSLSRASAQYQAAQGPWRHPQNVEGHCSRTSPTLRRQVLGTCVEKKGFDWKSIPRTHTPEAAGSKQTRGPAPPRPAWPERSPASPARPSADRHRCPCGTSPPGHAHCCVPASPRTARP